MTDNATNIPRIVTNAEEFGSVEQRDIDRFREIYARWPEKYRKLIETNGVAFVLGTNREIGLMSIDYKGRKSWGPGKVNIDANELNEEQFKAQAKEAGVSYRTYTNLIHKIMFRSLLAALGDGAANVNWQPAFQEAKRLQLQHQQADFRYSDKIDYTRPELILNDGRGNSEKSIGRPEAQKVYEQYMAFIDGEYEKLERQHQERIRFERAAKYQADDTRFAINEEQGVLTRGQRKYFDKVNELIAALGVTPKQFDDQLRCCVVQQLLQNSIGVYHRLSALHEEHGGKPAGEKNLDVRDQLGELDRKLEVSYPPKNQLNRLFDKSGVWYNNVAPLLAIDGYEQLHIPLGILDLSQPISISSKESYALYFALKQTLEAIKGTDWIEQKCAVTTKAHENVIQSYCSGSRSIYDLASIRPGYTHRLKGDTKEVTFKLPPAADYLFTSIHNAALALAHKKGITGGQLEQIHTIVDELDKVLQPQAVMRPEEYEKYAATEVRISAQTVLPYNFNNKTSIAFQLQQTNRPLFSKELKLLAASMDCRMARHQALADAVFADAYLTVAKAYEEWRSDKGNAHKIQTLQSLLDPQQHPETAAARQHAQEHISIALAAAQNMTEGDELTGIYRGTQEHMAQVLKQCPTLLGCVPEKIEEELRQELQKPTAYAFTNPAYTRINREARKDFDHAPDDVARALIKNMQALRDILLSFTCVENLDIKIPQHKAFADAAFNDEVLARLEYAFRPTNGGHSPGLDSAARQRIRDAIAGIYAIDQSTPDISPERLATNERLKGLIEQTPALVIAALGSNKQMQGLREKLQLIYTDKGAEAGDNPRQPPEVIAEVQRELRDLSNALLNEAGAKIAPPQPELVVITTGGRVVITDRASAPPEECRLLTFTQEELDAATITRKVEQELPQRLQELQGQYGAIEDQLIVIAVNERNTRDALLHRIRDAFATGTSISMRLEEATVPPPPPHEDQPPDTPPTEGATYEPWFRPIDQSVGIARHFANQWLAHEPSYRLFCCHTTPTPNGRYALILKMYRYAEEDDGRIVIAMPPESRSLVVGDTQEYAHQTLQAVQRHVLRMPGITRYVRLDQSRVEAGNDVVIPDRPIANGNIINGNGTGEVFGRSGKLYLRLRYNPLQGAVPPQAPVTVELDLQYTQDGQNYAPARDRADDVIAEIQQRQQQDPAVTRDEMNRWIRDMFGRAQPTIGGDELREPTHFPQDDQTVVIGSPLIRKLYPQDMWEFQLKFEYGKPPMPLRYYNDENGDGDPHRRRRGGNEIRDVTLMVPLHTSNLEHALELRKRVVKAVKYMLENERDRAQWDWLDEESRTLNDVRHHTPAEGPPHEFMDASRLLDICYIAGAFEGNHRLVLHSRERDDKDNLVATYRLQRTYRGQGIEDYFHEWDPNNPDGAPIILERRVIFPPNAPDDAARNLELEAQQRMERSFTKFHSFSEAYATEPDGTPIQQFMRTQQQYNPATIINDFQDSLAQPLELDHDGDFHGGIPGWPRPPRNRSNGNGGNGSRRPPTNGMQRHEDIPAMLLEPGDHTFTQRFGGRNTGGYKQI